MPDRRGELRELEAALRECAPAWPPTPDLAAAIRPRLAPRRARRRGLKKWLLGVLAGAVAATMAIEPARSAVLELLGLRAVTVERRTADPAPRPFGAALDLGRASTLDLARRATGLRVMPSPTLREPAGVWVSEAPAAVSLVHRRPRILVQVLDARVAEPVLGKTAGPGVSVQRVRGGFFLSGAPHGVGYLRRDGVPVVEPQRLAGNTLLVERDGVLIRVEGRLTRERALAIADSTRVARDRP